MGWFMSILGITNLIVVGCMHFAYAQAGKYKEHMLLGVTLSEQQMEDEDIRAVAAQFQKQFRFSCIVGYISAIAVLFFFSGYISIALIAYLIWMFGYIFWIQYVYVKYHKKLYKVKKAKGYTCGSTVREISVDTRLSRLKDTMPISADWFLPSIIILLLPLCSASFREYAAANPREILLMYSVILFVKAAYYFLYYLFSRQRSVVYSQNSDLNIACNRSSKRGYSILFVTLSLIDSISFLMLLWDEMSVGYFTMVSLVVFVVLQSLVAIGLVFGMYLIRNRRKELLKGEEETVLVDEDDLWASGFYNNPQDNRLFVQDRQNSANMTLNYGKSSAWVLTLGFLGGTFLLLLWLSVVLLRLDFVPARYQVAENFQIIAPSYSKDIEFSEIKSLRLLDELPDIRLSKQDGAATDQYALGKFYSRNQGTCYLYVYYGYSPIVELELEDMTIYFNSKEDGVAEKCYEQLLEKTEQKVKDAGEP